ncbi:hypothetical protein D3C87_1128670 [compost metagenome]
MKSNFSGNFPFIITLNFLIQTSVFNGAHCYFLFEKPCKMLWVFDLQFVGNFADWLIDIENTLFDLLYLFWSHYTF